MTRHENNLKTIIFWYVPPIFVTSNFSNKFHLQFAFNIYFKTCHLQNGNQRPREKNTNTTSLQNLYSQYKSNKCPYNSK